MKMYKTDLHIHTCLSPCAELEMSPMNIVKQAKKCGLDIIGICDHNSCENVPYVKNSAEKEGLNFFGGIEITSKEEVHILALFENEDELFSMQKIIYEHLHGTNNENMYGDQIVVNEYDEILKFNKKFLIGATTLTVEEIVDAIHVLNGLSIASHIDRDSFSILGQLGFIPTGLQLDALEVSAKCSSEVFDYLKIPLITSSDAHMLAAIGNSFTQFCMEKVNLNELKKSLLGEDNRKVVI
jgi:predicted metal-dependent phosphoesterase TrpH